MFSFINFADHENASAHADEYFNYKLFVEHIIAGGSIFLKFAE